jgi:hypothetical protein
MKNLIKKADQRPACEFTSCKSVSIESNTFIDYPTPFILQREMKKTEIKSEIPIIEN